MLPDLATILGPGLAPELRGRAAEALQGLERAGEEVEPRDPRLRATSGGREEVAFSDSEEEQGGQGDTLEEVEFLGEEVKEGKKNKKNPKRRARKRAKARQVTAISDGAKASLEELVEQLEEVGREEQGQVVGREEQGQVLEQIASSLPQNFLPDGALSLATSISGALSTAFSQRGEAVATTGPISKLFTGLKPCTTSLTTLLASLATLQPTLGSRLLHHLVTAAMEDEHRVEIYRMFCSARGLRCEAGLARDLQVCRDEDTELLVMVVPHLYRLMAEVVLGRVDILHLLVSCLDGSQLLLVVEEVVGQQLTLLTADTCAATLQASLEWETLEQMVLWQIYHAHDLPVSCLVELMPHLRPHHSEAAAATILALKKKKPSEEMLARLVERPPGNSMLAAMFAFWHRYCGTFPALLGSFLVGRGEGEGAGRLVEHCRALAPRYRALLAEPAVRRAGRSLLDTAGGEVPELVEVWGKEGEEGAVEGGAVKKRRLGW